MVDVIYIEREVLTHPRTDQICARFPLASKTVCERYGEVFNPKGQNFRLQKRRPGLILAKKRDPFVLPVPDGYGVGADHNFYFSHMLNCIYDCRYCFLQGMYRSAHYVLFVNYEDFAGAISQTANEVGDQSPAWFFSGYDGDSLAYEPVTGFVEFLLNTFQQVPSACLELRTKSTQVRSLLDRAPLRNVVIAFSFTPQRVGEVLENKVPAIGKRIAAATQLQDRGWSVGLRFDPLIYYEDYKAGYTELFANVFAQIDPQRCHSVTFGPFRLPQDYFRTLLKLYPAEPLFAGPLTREAKVVTYRPELESLMLEDCRSLLANYVGERQLFPHAVAG